MICFQKSILKFYIHIDLDVHSIITKCSGAKVDFNREACQYITIVTRYRELFTYFIKDRIFTGVSMEIYSSSSNFISKERRH